MPPIADDNDVTSAFSVCATGIAASPISDDLMLSD